MAGRIVVLQFDSKTDGEQFVREMKAEGVVIDNRSYPDDSPTTVYAKVLGIYLLPTQFCKCIRKGKRDHAEARDGKLHSKYKIWVCRTCGRPSQYWNKGIPVRLRMALGWNLDDPEPIA